HHQGRLVQRRPRPVGQLSHRRGARRAPRRGQRSRSRLDFHRIFAGSVSGRAALAWAVAALALVAGSYYLFFVRPERGAERARAQAPETLVIASLSGGVEIAAGDGSWRPARVGEKLSARDRIRTDDEGAAELLAADGSTVQLAAGTEARVDELRRELKRLSLGRRE